MIRNYHLATCPTTGKRGFETRALARRSRRDSHFQDVSVYPCESCGLFHVGGWHGTKDRAAHRHETEETTIPIIDAARLLNVSSDFIRRLITADKVRHRDGQPYRADIERLTTQ